LIDLYDELEIRREIQRYSRKIKGIQGDSRRKRKRKRRKKERAEENEERRKS
jgi:hypothetical protein